MKKYNSYGEAARHRKRDEMTIINKQGQYMNQKVWTEPNALKKKLRIF